MEEYGKQGKAVPADAKMKDYQPGENQFAGKEMGKTNMYVERTDRTISKEAGKIKKQAYKGRYE